MDINSTIAILTSELERRNKDLILLESYLIQKGFKVNIIVWNNLTLPLGADLVMVGPVWDYTSNYSDFLDTCRNISLQCKLVNEYKTIEWNSDKIYLKDYIQNDIRCIPSKFFTCWDEEIILSSIEDFSISKIIKPSIGAGGRGIFKVEALDDLKESLAQIKKSGSLIVQDFIESISNGEISSIFIDGIYSHSILKRAVNKEFRVQDHYGGIYTPYEPSKKELNFFERILEITPHNSYARVDYIRDNDPLLVEVELIEPDIFLRYNKNSLHLIYEMIRKAVSNKT